MPAYHGRPSSRIPTIKSPGCTVSTWQTLRGTRRLWVELCSHSIEAIILSTVHSKDAIQKLTISILPLPKMNKESVGSAIHDIRASPTTIAANQCGSQQRYECWWHNTGTRVLGGVHKNRKDQILVMQGWRAESNKTWKTPLGISSPRTRSILK